MDPVNTVHLAKALVVVFCCAVSKITSGSTWQADSPTVRAAIVKLAEDALLLWAAATLKDYEPSRVAGTKTALFS